jgi:hypothetical protein
MENNTEVGAFISAFCRRENSLGEVKKCDHSYPVEKGVGQNSNLEPPDIRVWFFLLVGILSLPMCPVERVCESQEDLGDPNV